MATADDLRRLALALAGTTEAPHFDRAAFKVKRIYATLGATGEANLKFSPEDQALKCAVAADAFSPVPNAWGRQGWTIMRLARVSEEELADALRTAWMQAGSRRKKG